MLLLAVNTATLSAAHIGASPLLDSILDAKSLRGAAAVHSPHHALSTELAKCIGFYKSKIETYARSLLLYKTHLPAIHAVTQAMRGREIFAEDGGLSPFYAKSLRDVLLVARAELAPMHCDALEAAFLSKLPIVFKHVLDVADPKHSDGSSSPPAAVDKLTAMKDARELVALADRAFSGH